MNNTESCCNFSFAAIQRGIGRYHWRPLGGVVFTCVNPWFGNHLLFHTLSLWFRGISEKEVNTSPPSLVCLFFNYFLLNHNEKQTCCIKPIYSLLTTEGKRNAFPMSQLQAGLLFLPSQCHRSYRIITREKEKKNMYNYTWLQNIWGNLRCFHVSLQEWWINFQAPMMLDFPDVWVQTLTSQTHMSHYHTRLMQNKLSKSHSTLPLSHPLRQARCCSVEQSACYFLISDRKTANNWIYWLSSVYLLHAVTWWRLHISLWPDSRKTEISLSQLQSRLSVQKSSEIQTEYRYCSEVCWEKTLPAYPSCPSCHERRVFPETERSSQELEQLVQPGSKQLALG